MRSAPERSHGDERMTKTKVSTTHENYSHDWHTPPEWLAWVKATLGPKYFDPCPAVWDGKRDGLETIWNRRTYCNHPGGRGSTRKWWAKYIREQERHAGRLRFIWCAFNHEQLRYMDPSPMHLPGWLIMPRDRVGYIWGGPTIKEARNKSGKITRPARVHGERMKSPSNWSIFWTNVEPATPPGDCVTVRTS